jgi:hypothetical protein
MSFVFSGMYRWIGAVHDCFQAVKLPAGTDLDALATYVLATMEGGVMLSRSYGSSSDRESGRRSGS